MLRRLASPVLLLLACGDDGGATASAGATMVSSATQPVSGSSGGASTDPSTDPSDASATAGASTGGVVDDSSGAPTGGGPALDLGMPDFGGGACAAEDHAPCDAPGGDPLQALGLNCPGELAVVGGFDGHAEGLRVISQWGAADTFTPREGQSFVVISTGDLAQMHDAPADPGDAAFHCNSWFPGGDGMDTTKFPPPITKKPVQGDCLDDPALVGTGDCSKSIQGQFDQSGFKYDYQELRFTAVVPPGAEALSFDVAFLTKEYPIWKDRPYNDMFIGWIESTHWTGNISFDAQGAPLSLNAAFLELYDDDGALPEFAGTCMRYSAGTRWLTTTADVVPGETIELVLAIFDLDDVNWDSFVLLDNVRWRCGDAPGPVTEPAG